MATIYVVVKGALNQHGTLMKCAAERAFTDKAKAAEYAKNLPVVWEEQADNMSWYCERGIHEIELD